jgi:hypothetical protein
MISWVSTALGLALSGVWTPPTSWVRVPVTMMASFSKSCEPVYWAKAPVGKAIAVVQRRISFFTWETPHG